MDPFVYTAPGEAIRQVSLVFAAFTEIIIFALDRPQWGASGESNKIN